MTYSESQKYEFGVTHFNWSQDEFDAIMLAAGRRDKSGERVVTILPLEMIVAFLKSHTPQIEKHLDGPIVHALFGSKQRAASYVHKCKEIHPASSPYLHFHRMLDLEFDDVEKESNLTGSLIVLGGSDSKNIQGSISSYPDRRRYIGEDVPASLLSPGQFVTRK